MTRKERAYIANDLRLAAYMELAGENWSSVLSEECVRFLKSNRLITWRGFGQGTRNEKTLYLLFLAHGVRKGRL